MEDTFKDPYEGEPEAKILTTEPPKRNQRIVIAVLVAVGLIVAIVILSNVAGMLTRPAPETAAAAKPTTMTREQSTAFAGQQAAQADYIKGQDADKRQRNDEDTTLGKAANLAGESGACDEVAGVPAMTAAQRQAAGCGGNGSATGSTGSHPQGEKSEAQIQRERLQLEAQHRRQNDIDPSPVALDFSDYFDNKETVAAASAQPPATPQDPEAAALEAKAAAVHEQRQRVLSELERRQDHTADQGEAAPVASVKEPHDPQEDYVFDSSYGKLYRLMEDTIVECVLVNRLAGAAPGPVVVMVRENVYSHSGGHLLIPKGTRLLGKVTAVASLGQERLFVAFHRMIMSPDGYSVSLDKFQGLDVMGQVGLRDLVNHHYVQIFGASLALAAVGAVTQIGNAGAAYGSYDFGVSMRNGASQQLGQSSQRIMERFLNTLPTFTIRERALVKVMLSGDLLLPDTKNHNMDPDL